MEGARLMLISQTIMHCLCGVWRFILSWALSLRLRCVALDPIEDSRTHGFGLLLLALEFEHRWISNRKLRDVCSAPPSPRKMSVLQYTRPASWCAACDVAAHGPWSAAWSAHAHGVLYCNSQIKSYGNLRWLQTKWPRACIVLQKGWMVSTTLDRFETVHDCACTMD